jgi:hypothetical protein
MIENHPQEGWELLCAARQSQSDIDIQMFNKWAQQYEGFEFPPFHYCVDIKTFDEFFLQHRMIWFVG